LDGRAEGVSNSLSCEGKIGIFEQVIEEDDELPHHGREGHFFGFTGGDQPGVTFGRQLSPLQDRRSPLFSSIPSMQKTKKSVAKRFKLTSTGKLVRRTPGFRHLLAAKSTKQKRRASRDKLVAEGHAKPLKRCLPFGL
jgi:large subunit ribosomal protein L35